MFRMDTVVRLEPGVMLQNLTRAKAAKVKRLRWSVEEEVWFPVTRDSRVEVLDFATGQLLRDFPTEGPPDLPAHGS